ncbi:kinase-like domain-containing protein [Pelagophyceae sp. CCMP2097]|nr:kinase-like domain-containing protein [Pelagophyceae sp. CCMP2097]
MSEQPFSPSDFTRLRVLGQGAYGKVYLVKKSSFPDPGKTYAMKVMNKADLVKGALQDQAYVERDITRDARHAFVARLRHSFQTESRLYLLMDYYAGGPLHDALRRAAPKADGRCTVGQMRFYAAELVLGLEYLHGRGIVHRDIKPPNVLIDAQGHVAITDFGMAIRSRGEDDEDAAARRREGSPPRSTMFCGTDEYMAPEIFSRGKDYGFAVDWWALGVLCYDVVAGRSPFRPTRSDCDREQLTTAKGIRMKLWENILRKQPDYPADKFDDADAVSFLSALLTKDESSRPSTSERIRSMPFFRELDWARAEQCHLEPPFVPSVYCALIGFRKTWRWTARSWGHVSATPFA